MNKEYLYVGHYIDIDGNYILKVGTTKNPTKEDINIIHIIEKKLKAQSNATRRKVFNMIG